VHLRILALPYLTQGRFPEAELLYHRALAIDEKALSPEHPAETSANSPSYTASRAATQTRSR
jgi:hypothetical protein